LKPRFVETEGSMSELKALQEWYALMADGDWEHEFGVSIETIDNPGWVVSVDLEGTPLDGSVCDVDTQSGDGEWLRATCDGKKFEVACGPRSLDRAIGTFIWFSDVGSGLTAQQRAERGARGEPAPGVATGGTRSSRDLFTVAKDGVEDSWWHLTVTQDDGDGYTLYLESPSGDSWVAEGPNAWDALRALRMQVEPLGYRLCCAGARINAYVSGMSVSMSAGELAYPLHRWRRPRTKQLVEIFSYAPAGKVGTVAEQDRFYEEWKLRSWMRIF
jgi:hypothetical protein